MHRLCWADADQDSQDFGTGCSLCHRRIAAVPALLDRRHVECRRVGNRLDVGIRTEVGIGSWNGGELAFAQTRDGLGELEVGIVRLWSLLRYRVHQLVSSVSCM